MKNKLFYRILTSFFLFIVVYLIFISNIFSILFLTIIFIISLYEFYQIFHLIKKNLKLTYQSFVFCNILSFFYLFFSIMIVYSSLIDEKNDKVLILFILAVCILNDIGGILFGKLIGGKKLTKISPNKTLSGSIGGIVLSFLFLFIFVNYINNYSLLELSIIVIVTSLFSQIGDLVVSFFKRKAKIKDTGNILPGHGGMLDRIDGILLGLPIGIIILNLIS